MNKDYRAYINRLLTKEFIQGIATVIFFSLLIYFGVKMIGIENIREKVESAGVFAPLLFIAIKSSTIIFTPLGGGPLYLSAEPLFGYSYGAIYIFLGDLIGYTIVFYISRSFGQKILHKLLTENQTKSLNKILNRVGNWQSLMIIRIVLFSFQDIISYAAGFTKIPYWQFILTTVPIIAGVALFYMGIGTVFIKDTKSFVLITAIFTLIPFAFLLIKYLLKISRNTYKR